MRNFDAIYRPTYQTPPPVFNKKPPKKRRRRFKWLILLILILGMLGYSGSSILSKTNKIFTNKENIFVRVGRLILGDDKHLKGEESGIVNILLLGMGGPGHEGPFLTDTMMIASIDLLSKEVVLISIPRDFVVSLPKRGFQKINSAYAYAEMEKEGSGGSAAIAATEKVTGLLVPYYAAIDFNGFIKAVEHIGGLDITIDRTFTDSHYPDNKKGYLEPVTFTKGQEHMDGERALIFARSRKGNNNEGSDFARSERQKKIIQAFKDKVSSINVTDIKTITNLLSEFTQNFRTNLEPYELKRLSELGKGITSDNIYSLSLEPDNHLICQGIIEDYTSRAYVIQPCEGKTYADIRSYLDYAPTMAKLAKEGAIIEIHNTTGKSYALEQWRRSDNMGLEIKYMPFKGKGGYERTILYDNSKGGKEKTLEYLKKNFNFTISDVPYYDASEGTDFVIMLGKDAL
jgi:polyisoprenyl-teichoic acid--peptidoglycan teichoic acid transferase